ncbi:MULTISPECIES: MFS transporter [unclassified Brevibacterium]|uniref:MFS transporter n=1 Tax=unclassified Brevibacterium TaxID=2614124 RepID=UPI000B252DF3|nr:MULTISPECIES: MFS transporter [unclassified Brevibacterium]
MTGPRTSGVAAAWITAAGLLAISLNLRAAVSSIGPVIGDIRADLGFSAAAASLLTTIPVVAFGIFAFAAPGLSQRLGMRRLLGLVLLVLAAGILLRSVPGLQMLFLGTCLVGAAIAVGNVVIPAVIKSDFAAKSGLMMGLYSAFIGIGASLGSGLTVPLRESFGGSWRWALAAWAGLAVFALLAWVPQLLRRGGSGKPSGTSAGEAGPGETGPAARGGDTGAGMRQLLADPVAIAVTLTMGIQSMTYYASLTWVPSIFMAAGMPAQQAGWMVAFTVFPSTVTSLLAPIFAQRVRPTWLPMLIAVGLGMSSFTGLLFAPLAAPYVWMTLMGFAQGALLALCLSFIVWRSPSVLLTAKVSTMAQGFGYILAAAGPIGMGALHSLSGGWTVPIIALLCVFAVLFAVSVLAARDAFVLGGTGRQIVAD